VQHAGAQYGSIFGSLNIRNYSNAEYNGHTQMFSITQDARGVMYFGNKSGVLEYDGVSWRTIKVYNKNGDSREVNSLATDKTGQIYVAAREDLGVLAADKRGKVQFKSLKHKFTQVQDLKSPRKILAYDDGVLFQYGGQIFQYSNGKFKVYTSSKDDPIYGVFNADGKIYVAKEKTGLHTLIQGKFKPVVNGAFFGSQNKIYSILNFSNGTYIQTSEGNIFNFTDPSRLKEVVLDFSRPTYNAINVFDRYFSSGSFSDGLLIYDKDFRLTYQLDITNGLIDNNVNCQYLDKEGSIWVGTNKGISKIDVITPVSRFGVNHGLSSGVESICSFKGRVYFATLSGIFYLNESFTKMSDRIVRLPGLNIDCYGIKTLAFGKDTVLMIAANNGVWMMKDRSGPLTFVSKCGPYNFVQSPLDPNEVFVANYDGLSKLRWANGYFVDEGYLSGFNEEIFNISVEDDGTLWLGTIQNGIIKSHVTAKGKKHPKKIIGNPDDGPTYISVIDDVPYVGNDKGLFRIAQEKLIPSTEYKLPKKCSVHRIMKDGSGKVWAVLALKNNQFEIGYFENDGTHRWNTNDFRQMTSEIMHGIFYDENNFTWLGGPNGVLLYNSNVRKEYNLPFQVLLRKVSVGETELFSGAFRSSSGNPLILQPNEMVSEIHYTSKGISFEFAAGSFIDEGKTLYSFKLVGQDEEWSPWSSKSEKGYTNLNEGKYTFLVKAKNVFGKVSETASFKFVILPPWYRTWWAYSLYVLLIAVCFYGIIKLANRRILVQKEQLERLVKERTAEVIEQKELVEKQKELVEDKNRSIMDSIKYAKRLQDAILPTDEYIKDCFSDFFVFYRPKDIVSGDFYWVRKIGNKVYFAVVDCTGHGVPGAILSIVGNNGLNRAVREFGLQHPSDILDKLSVLVEDAFKQEGTSEVKDGMDLSLCCLDLTTYELEFSGANNPLYVISENELSEIKGNKQPVGPYSERTPFINHRIQLKKNDILVLFSDGYADQFGGANGKKLKYTKFKTLLLDHSDSPMEQVGEQISAEFDEWKGSQDQVDDVCVLAIRI
jgi:serine phosphatase RsbU (regulator of sigma subunit)/ligand-binding sensor domain-containing protein